MVYDNTYKYRTPVWNEHAYGPVAIIHFILFSVYSLGYYFRYRAVGNDKTLLCWRPLSDFPNYSVYMYDQGKFFGSATRSTRLVCFKFSDSRINVQDDDGVVQRNGKFLILTAQIVYEPETEELRYSDERREESNNFRFQIMCEESQFDKNRTKVSMAVSFRTYENAYGVQVTGIDWIDADYIKNDRMRYSRKRRRPRSGASRRPRSDATPLRPGNFPYNRQETYKKWHIVMGNGCRIKVRVTVVACESMDRNDLQCRWTLSNTDNHMDYDECVYILQEYYSSQAKNGVVCPLSRRTIGEFIASNQSRQHRIQHMEWLVYARVERPSSEGTPPSRFADHQVSHLFHAMVLKSLLNDNNYDSIEYDRFESVSSE